MANLGLDVNKVIPHGSYLVNLGNADPAKRSKACDNFVDDMKRCEALGIGMHDIHPGSTCGEISTEESIKLVAGCINRAHSETSNVVVVLENCAGAKNTIGSFEDLGQLIALITAKHRIGVCLDTCHAFASGEDLRTKEAYEVTMKRFDELVGFKYLKAIHLNDSKGELGSRKDRHENIGRGYIGLDGFRNLINDPRVKRVPIVLETPEDKKDSIAGYRREIGLVYSLVD